jgi:hypothetical protein
MQPRFPIYIPSKSRAENGTTARFLDAINVPYKMVVEEQQFDEYSQYFSTDKLLILDPEYLKNYDTFDDLGDTKSKGPGAARNFIWDHSVSQGHAWHWVMDDNIVLFARLHKNQRIPVGDGTIFHAMEEFVLRYKNIAMAGPQYWMFAPSRAKLPPFVVGTRIYSCNLIRNDVPFRWRGRYNEDTDLSLRMLKDNWQTVQFNAFLQYKLTTQTLTGGNTEAFYAEEGTLPKSQMLVKMHPDVTKLVQRFNRWHHHVNYGPFKNIALLKKEDVVISVDNPYKSKLIPRKNNFTVAVESAIETKHSLIDFYQTQINNLHNLENPQYPIYVPSKKRANIAKTPQLLENLKQPYVLVVEKEDLEEYKSVFPNAEYLVLPESNQGIIYARNEIKKNAEKRSSEYHWQIDDDIRGTCFSINAKETNLPITQALSVAESCVQSYENIGSIGLRHMAFSRTEKHTIGFNKIVYTIQLLKTDTDICFRDNTIEDVDYTLQLLNKGFCTVVLNRLLFKAPSTGSEVGGNTEIEHTREKRLLRAQNTANYWPEAKWKIKDTSVGAKLGSTRIWSTFEQRPVPKEN